VPFAWTFTPLDVGIETGLFAKQGLTVESSAFGGDAKLQQAMAADGIDIGIGSGPGMAFTAKGAPVKAVAAMAGIPTNMAVMVSYNSSAFHMLPDQLLLNASNLLPVALAFEEFEQLGNIFAEFGCQGTAASAKAHIAAQQGCVAELRLAQHKRVVVEFRARFLASLDHEHTWFGSGLAGALLLASADRTILDQAC